VDVPSLGRIDGQAYSGSGTSQSTAITSAVAALVWSRYPNLDARGVATRLLATLDDRRSTPDPAYGYGQLDGYRAVTGSVPSDAPNPVYAGVLPFLARSAELAKKPVVPKPAAKPVAATGRFTIGSEPRITTQVIIGSALAAAGLALLLVLLGVGVRGRRRRQANLAPFSWSLPEAVAPAPVLEPRPARPRPGPGPRGPTR
jgi:subtilisin family serine protease